MNTDQPQNSHDARTPLKEVTARTSYDRSTLLLALIVVSGLTCAVWLSMLLEPRQQDVAQRVAAIEQERLYVSGETARRLSLGFNGLAADWYWMRSLQYVGRKVLAHEGDLSIDDLSQLDLRQLAPLLDTTTTLDPQFSAAYEYGAMILPAVDKPAARALLEKGIGANPTNWRLYHHLGYICWRENDFRQASEWYARGAKQSKAPAWMQAMSARMLAEGGSRQTAREIYLRISQQADDAQIKNMAELRLLQLNSLDERDRIRAAIKEFRELNNRCPSVWRELAPFFARTDLRIDARTGAPVDPSDTAYRLTQGGCDVDLDPSSSVPNK